MPLTSIAPVIDATGIHVPDFPTIQAWYQDQYRTIYGADVYLGNDSQDGQFLAIIASAMNDYIAALVDDYNSKSPATAQGAGLSSIVKINGISRAVPTLSTVDVQIVGVAGTVITNGVVGDVNLNKWNLPATVTIPNAGTITVTARAQVAGAITAAAGTVTSIITPTLGWQSVTNAAIAAPGSPVESDAALRARQAIAVALPAQNVTGGILAAVGNLTGVTEVTLHENYTDTTDSAGTPPHSISVMVVGGDVDEIAQAIALKKGEGVATFGTTSILTTDTNGYPITIQFSRPVAVNVTMVVNVTAGAGYSTAVTAEIVASLTDYINGLSIGQSVLFTRLWGPALLVGSPNQNTFEITSMTANGGTSDITVAYNAVATTLSVTVNVT